MSKSGNTERTTRAVPDDPTIGSSSERLNELAMSFKKSQALSAALECDLFSAIAAGAGTPEEVAAKCGIDREVADLMFQIHAFERMRGDINAATGTWRIRACDQTKAFVCQGTTLNSSPPPPPSATP